jgi:hypothetical protein
MVGQLFGITIDPNTGQLASGRVVNIDHLLPHGIPGNLQDLVGETVLSTLVFYERFVEEYRKTLEYGDPPNIMSILVDLDIDTLDVVFGCMTLLDIWFCSVVDAFRIAMNAMGMEMPMGMANGQELGIKFQEELRARINEITETRKTKGQEDDE